MPVKNRLMKQPIKSISFIAILLICINLGNHAQTNMQCYRADPNSGARSHVLNIKRMVLNVGFEPKQGLVKGKVTHYFTPLRKKVDSFFLDAPGIKFQEVKLNEEKVDYSTTSKGIVIYPDKPLKWQTDHKLFLDYKATPRKGIYFIGWESPDDSSRNQIWTQGQGTDNRHWIPCYDNPNDKLLTEVKVTFDKDYKVLSNGKQVNVANNQDGSKTWHYKMQKPHTTYLVMLAIGRYGIEQRTSGNGVPMKLYHYPDEPEKVKPTYRHSAKIMDIMERETGVSYPWSQYSQVPVQNFLYGAMENTTATIFGDFYYVDKRGALDNSYVYVNAHELAHHWFGDYITLNSNEHIWLHESFATHYGRLCEYFIYGDQHYQVIRERQLNRALSASDKNNRPIMASNAGTNRIYPKGALVLGMLKDVVGKKQFDRVVAHYLEKHAYKNVITQDFIMAFQEVLGMNLNWFFEQWIKHGGEPHYQVDYQSIQKNGSDMTAIEVKQIHEVNNLIGYFRMPINFEVHYEDGGKTRKKAWVEGPETTVKLQNPKDKEIAFVLFDPKNQVVKRLTFPKSMDELKAQALKAPNMVDRYDALKALRSKEPAKKRDVLLEAYNASSHYFLKKEIAKQLAKDRTNKGLAVLQKALNHPHHEVRGAVLQHVDSVPRKLRQGFKKALQDSSYRNTELALKKIAQSQPDNLDQYLATTRDVYGIGNSVKITWLELAVRYKSNRYLDELVAYAGHGYEFKTRVNAMKALKRLNHCNQKVVKHLIDAYLDPNSRLSNPARDVLNHFMIQHQYKPILKRYYQNQTWSKRKRNQLNQLMNSLN